MKHNNLKTQDQRELRHQTYSDWDEATHMYQGQLV